MRSRTLVLVPLVAVSLLRAQAIRFEAVAEPPQAERPKVTGPTIEAIEIHGTRMPHLRAILASRVGGVYDTETLRRDAGALYSTGRFSSVVWVIEPGPAGNRVHFVVVERPFVRSIEYRGANTVTVAEILERFRERKVKLGVETLLYEEELGRAAAAVEELVAERGRRNITVTPMVEPTSPLFSRATEPALRGPSSSVGIAFKIEEKR